MEKLSETKSKELKEAIISSKILDIPGIFKLLLGKLDFDSTKEKNEFQNIIKTSMKLDAQNEIDFVYDYFMQVKESIKPFRESLSTLDSEKKYNASITEGRLILSENDTKELEENRKKLEKENKLGIVSGGFLANFIHNYKGGSNLVKKAVLDLNIKYGDNSKDVDKIDLVSNEAKNTAEKKEVQGNAVISETTTATTNDTQVSNSIGNNNQILNPVPAESIKEFNSFKATLTDIFISNNKTINKNKCYSISASTYEKLKSVGVNLNTCSDVFIVALIQGQTTSSINVNQFAEGGNQINKELSFKLTGTLDNPNISVLNQEKKYTNTNIKEVKRSQKTTKKTVSKSTKLKV